MSVISPKANRRADILEAALEAFLEGGYHGTHVADVVKRCGIARGTFYLYFDSKHAVFAALIDQMLSVFLEARPEGEPPIHDRASAEEVLRMSYRTVFTTFRKHRRLCRLMFDEAVGVEQGFSDQLRTHYATWNARVRSTLQQLISVGVARKGLDVEVTAELVVGMVERITRAYLLPDAAPDFDRLITAMVDFELHGVLPSGPGS